MAVARDRPLRRRHGENPVERPTESGSPTRLGIVRRKHVRRDIVVLSPGWDLGFHSNGSIQANRGPSVGSMIHNFDQLQALESMLISVGNGGGWNRCWRMTS